MRRINVNTAGSFAAIVGRTHERPDQQAGRETTVTLQNSVPGG